ncbi:MAG: hypothetical protein Q8R55_06045 [Candidatus Taylorbacteria bacterium]|nr:hypothetical protein [Candidatus Taylorbacteria bacterium]
MRAISIPKTMAKEELLLMTRREYERLLGTLKKIENKVELDAELREAIREARKGKLNGPFSSVKDLRLSLEK